MRPPSVDTLARELGTDHPSLPHALLVQCAREGIAAAVHAGEPDQSALHARVAATRLQRTLLQPVINGTGTLLHTNLGRAPLAAHRHDHQSEKSDRADRADRPDRAELLGQRERAVRYSSLEFDLLTGRRGSRRNHASTLLATLSGAESALVVNNCAAALMLVIAAVARGRGVAVSRGELVEIGGAFRIPDVLASQGAALVEVGTTNRTRAADYERAMATGTANVGMVLSVHRSNYRISGFTETPTVSQLATVTRPRRVPLVVDTGSGLLDSKMPWLADSSGRVPALAWLALEPASKQTLDAGADLIVFSGDKLLGGPQAGIIAGRADLVNRCASHPLARALRPGGTVLSELQETCMLYLDGRAREIPFWEMATREVATLTTRAEHISTSLSSSAVLAQPCTSVPGGGTLPDAEIPSFGVVIAGDHTAALRQQTPAVIARTTSGTTVIDLRTVDPTDDDVLIDAIRAIIQAG